MTVEELEAVARDELDLFDRTTPHWQRRMKLIGSSRAS
jgi:hypothetical protein